MVRKLILGTVQLGLDYGINNNSGKPTLAKAFDILHAAFDNGIRILDTAEAYGNSQEVIGAFLKKNPEKRFHVISKLAANHSLLKNELLDHIVENLQTLSLDKLYGYMFHNYNSFKKSSFLYDDIVQAKELGYVDKIGVSLYSNDEIEDIITYYPEFDFIQIPFNLLDNASKRAEMMTKAKGKNIEIHTRSVFLQGLFFKESDNLPNKLSCFSTYLQSIERIKKDYHLNIETLALQYALQKDYIDHVLIGVDNRNQLISNLSICNAEENIPHHLIDTIDVEEIAMLNPANWNQ